MPDAVRTESVWLMTERQGGEGRRERQARPHEGGHGGPSWTLDFVLNAMKNHWRDLRNKTEEESGFRTSVRCLVNKSGRWVVTPSEAGMALGGHRGSGDECSRWPGGGSCWSGGQE